MTKWQKNVINWAVEGHVWTSSDEENDQDDMYDMDPIFCI